MSCAVSISLIGPDIPPFWDPCWNPLWDIAEEAKLPVHLHTIGGTLPDLRKLRPPKGNRKSGSEETCYFALKERGELGEVY